jgi:hypothetical protein
VADPEAGAKVAKDLGIYLGQLYGWVKAGKVKNYKEDGYPNGKGLLVDPNEARVAWMSSKKKGPRSPKEKAPRGSSKAKATGSTDSLSASEVKSRKLKAGTIVSMDTGRDGRLSVDSRSARPHYSLHQVLGQTHYLTYLDDGKHRKRYDGTEINNLVFYTDSLAKMLARGVARIERPAAVLGMVILSFILEDKIDLAKSLEEWMESEDLEVIVPEPLDDVVIEEDEVDTGATATDDD